MIRKPPLKTYQRKGIAQSSFNYSRTPLWPSKSYLVKKPSPNVEKIKPASASDGKYIEEVNSDYLETTFDKLAKDARLPTPPSPISNNLVNTSSDITTNVTSPDQIELFTSPPKGEPPKTRANRKPKRKPAQGRLVSEDTDVIVKKRLKHDLINISLKKAKAVRSSKRKICSKNRKIPVDNTQKKEIHTPDSPFNGIEAMPVALQSKSNKNPMNNKKKRVLRRRKNVRRIYSSSSENSNFVDCSVGVDKFNPKLKPNFSSERNTGSGKLKLSTGVDTLSSVENGSSKINVPDTKDEMNGFVDVEQASEGHYSASMEIRYAENPRKIRDIPRRTMSNNFENNLNRIDQPGCSKTDTYNEANKENLLIKPCFIVLTKYSEKNNPIVSAKESSIFLSPSDVCSNADIFQSSISKVASNIDPESTNIVEISSRESKKNIKIYNGNKKRDRNRALHYLKCSTPLSSYVTINRSINDLSPILRGKERQNDLKNDKFSVENSTNKPENRLLTINDKECLSSNKEYVNTTPKDNFRRKSSRKQHSISYEEDVSFEKSCEYYEKNDVKTASVENIESQRVSLRNANPDQIKSSNSHIQKTLEILKIDLQNPSNSHAVNINYKRRLRRRDIFTGSTETDRSISVSGKTNKYESTSEFMSKSKDSCAQLTPIGIITTRSGRQLQLTVTAKEKSFNNDSDPQIQVDASKIVNDSNSDSSCEIIENSETTNNRARKSTHFSVLKSHNGCNSLDGVKLLNSIDKSIKYINASTNVEPVTSGWKGRVSNDSIAYRSLNARSNLREESSDDSSKGLIRNSESSSIIDENVSALSNKQINSSVSVSTDKKVLQSIMNCTKNIDSLSIRPYADEQSEYSSSSNKANDDSNNSEWFTQSSSENNDSAASEIPEIIEDDLKLENQSCSSNDDGNSTSWSTITSNENSNDAISDLNESTKNETMERDKLSLNSSQDSSIHNEIQSQDERLSEARNEELRSGNDQSPELNELLMNKRMELLSIRINTRRRRKMLLKPDTKHIEQVVKEQSLVESPKDDREAENEANPHNKLEKSDRFEQPLLNLQPIVLLEKLNDPVTLPKTKKQSWELRLTGIHEQSEKSLDKLKNTPNKSSIPDDNRANEICDEFQRPDIIHSRQEKSETNNTSFKANVVATAPDSNYSIKKLNASELELIEEQTLFLKPGKEWARSLSILNNIQNGLDVELSCTGKGKNWRSSVQSILDMQQERVVESCLRKNEDYKEAQPCHRASVANRTSCLEDQSIGSASPSRFTRRMSIRVVPENKRLSHIEDTPFLEAYGITASKSRKTLSTRSKLKSDRESLVSNVQYEDVGIEVAENEHITTAKDVVLQRCGQEDYIPFTEYFPDEYLEMCRKIGEGVYGEVFLYENGKEKCVIKIIPIEGYDLVNGERQKRFDEILSEIVTAKELHNLRYGENCRTDGFVEVRNVRCINGKYPDKLIELWKAYDDDKGSDNDCPSMFDEDQLYIVLELGHGGQDLEAFVFQSAVESHAIFVQAALALAVAEQSLEFEHRDLHWGNILISRTKNSRVTFRLNDEEYSYPSKGMQVAIIDFTLSRMSYEGCCIFNDLALDPALFTAQGEYQFEVYRLMRDKIGNNWQTFEPYTNILWLHYVLDKMITALRYKRKTTKVHKDAILQLQKLKDVVLDYDSAFDFITNCDKITCLQRKSPGSAKSTQVL